MWGSYNKTLFDVLQHIHVRAAKIIYHLDWCTPTEEVLTPSYRSLCGILIFTAYLYLLTRYYERMSSQLKDLLVKHETNFSLRKQLCFNMATPKTEIVKTSVQYTNAYMWNTLDKMLWERIFRRRCTKRVWICFMCIVAVALHILGVGWEAWSGRRGVIPDVSW